MLKLISINGLIVINADPTLNNTDNDWTENVNTVVIDTQNRAKISLQIMQMEFEFVAIFFSEHIQIVFK